MKGKSKSVKIKNIIAALMLLAPAACGNFETPHAFRSSDLPADVAAEPRHVPVPTETDSKSWPRIGDVPDKPKDFSSPKNIDHTISRMTNDRVQAESIRNQVGEAGKIVNPPTAYSPSYPGYTPPSPVNDNNQGGAYPLRPPVFRGQ